MPKMNMEVLILVIKMFLMEQKTYAGLVTRLDEEFIYIWGTAHRLHEVFVQRSLFPEITAGDVVQYKITGPLNTAQEDANLTKVSNHTLTILYPPHDNSQIRIRTSILFPPKNSTYFNRQYEAFRNKQLGCSLKFAAFSMEFGTVASFVDLNHEPGKAYKAYVARLPLHCDQLKAYIDTLFCVVNAELKEIQDEREFQLIESRAPWKEDIPVREAKESFADLFESSTMSLNSYKSYGNDSALNSNAKVEQLGTMGTNRFDGLENTSYRTAQNNWSRGGFADTLSNLDPNKDSFSSHVEQHKSMPSSGLDNVIFNQFHDDALLGRKNGDEDGIRFDSKNSTEDLIGTLPYLRAKEIPWDETNASLIDDFDFKMGNERPKQKKQVSWGDPMSFSMDQSTPQTFAMKFKNFTIFSDRVIVERFVPEVKSRAPLSSTEKVQQKVAEGVVVAVGPGLRTDDGRIVPMQLCAGDRVLLPEIGGLKISADGSKECVVFKESEIIGKYN